MGEWTDFYEDFPAENPANWINGVYIGANGAAKIIAAGKERPRLKERDG